jgi:hypothetical protein
MLDVRRPTHAHGTTIGEAEREGRGGDARATVAIGT